MPVQVPKIQRFQSQAPDSVGRINIQADNPDEANAIVRKAVGGVIDKGVEAYEEVDLAVKKQEAAAREIKATSLQNTYETNVKTELEKIKALKGDTTPHYQKLQEDMTKWQTELSQQVGEDADLAAVFNNKVARSNSRLGQAKTLAQVRQQLDFRNETVKETIKLRQDDAYAASELVDMNNPGTMVPLMTSVDAIESALAAKGEMDGFPVKREVVNGVEQVVYAPAVENQIKAEIGNTINPIVKTLNAAGKVKEAKEIITKYQRWLSADDQTKLVTGNQSAQLKSEALVLIAENNLSGADGYKKIEEMPVSEDLKAKVREQLHIRINQERQSKKFKTEKTITDAMNDILSRRGKPSAYSSVEQWREANPQLADSIVTPGQYKQLESLIGGPPKASDTKVLQSVYERIEEGTAEDYTVEELLELRTKLSSRDYNKVERLFIKGNGPQTDSQIRGAVSSNLKGLGDRISSMKDEDGDLMFPKDKQGKLQNPDDFAVVADLKTKLSDYIIANPSVSNNQIVEKQKELVAEAVEYKKENGGSMIKKLRNKLLGGSKPKLPSTPTTTQQAAPAVTPAASAPKTLPGASDRAGWIAAYKAENPGKSEPTGNDIATFRRKKLAGK